MVAKHVNKKNASKPRFLAIYAILHSLAALAATFSAVVFKATAKVNLREFSIANPTPARRVYMAKFDPG